MSSLAVGLAFVLAFVVAIIACFLGSLALQIVGIIFAILLLLPVIITLQSWREMRLKAPTTFQLLPGPDKRLIIVLPPTGVHAGVHYKAQLSIMQLFGRVLLVDYPVADYTEEQVLDDLYRQLQEAGLLNQPIFLVGSSYGGELQEYTKVYLQKKGLFICGMMLIAPPVDGQDILQAPPRWFVVWARGGSVAQWIFRWLHKWKMPLNPANVHPDVDLACVQEDWDDVDNFPMIVSSATVRHLLDRQPWPREHRDVPVTIIWTERDVFIRQTARPKLERLYPDAKWIFVSDDHANLVTQAPVYQRLFRRILAAVLPS